ncbi:integrase-like protein [Orenia metallireducens]|uniref:Integrase core domain-containing protein n=1 Tax=Orenia metallireducens TaxID=1413210 RepID=A0A285IIF9_9FIRM|nr:integrase-like protein [Orenia metallireducens]SNY46866.1 Integrase core domain-containing protein [Orenia metallireducens]
MREKPLNYVSNLMGEPHNAVAESFFGTLKNELIHHKVYQTRRQARQDIFEYIEVFYNRFRMHSTLNYKSPEDYENERKTTKLCV